MRDLVKAAVSLSWATSLFAISQLARLAGAPSSERRATAAPDVAVAASGRTNVRCLVALGEGLAAGVGDFGWSENSQGHSFVAQAARQMGAPFRVPLLQSPGIYVAPGLSDQPVVLPHLLQTTVVAEFPARHRYNNLALPSYELFDCVRLRPKPPLVHRDDAKQTAANLVLGLAPLTTDPGSPGLTQLENALALEPTLAIVEFGYAEALRIALSRGATAAIDVDAWAAQCREVVSTLRGCGSDVIIATVPDPADTAACLPLDAAARALRTSTAALQQRYGLDARDCLTVAALTAAAFDTLGGRISDAVAAGVFRASARTALSASVDRMNESVSRIAASESSCVFDLHRLLRRVREEGIRCSDRLLTADFLGGFYTLNGAYPGATGHAVIANALLDAVNRHFGAAFPLVDLASTCRDDPVADYRPPNGDQRAVTVAKDRPPDVVPAAGTAPPPRRAASSRRTPLRLPPTLEITLSLAKAGSYHGDAIRVVDCRDDAEVQYGSCPGVLFGGYVLFDSHLAGALRIRFHPPENDLARFEIAFEPLSGDDGVLSAPMFFRWPVRQARVVCEAGDVSGGTVNLITGEVTDLRISVRYLNSALEALVGVNPGFPDQPIVFPGQYGSAWARFDQSDDGSLDFTFFGSTFLPLGGQFGSDVVRWALPFAGASGAFASIPARGLALHPHLHLTTLDPAEDRDEFAGAPVDLPHNTVCELTLVTRRSSFGDRFTLNTPELGGPATGRSHLLGRLLIQTGESFGNSLPVALSLVTPGGLLGQQAPSALTSLFPGRLSPGPMGHDEHLRFPTRNYFLDGVTLVDDPFDVSVGAVDLRTGRFLGDLLHRGFIGQDLFFALIRVEPRTPQSSFLFRGPAALQRGAAGELVFRHRAVVRIPYPAGFAFPAPDFTSAIVVGPDSLLDPYLWVRATTDDAAHGGATLRRDGVRASTGDEFSYSLEIADREGQPVAFEYSNHSDGGTFRLETLSWFGRARVQTAAGDTDMFTLSGFGRWSKDATGRSHQVAAQIAVGADAYVSIQIDGGLVSNVNTRPADETAAWP